MERKATNVTFVDHRVTTEERWRRNGHRGGILWLTGLSASGKSTLAMAAERWLFEQGWQGVVLDGDNLRYGLCADLGFSPEDRAENIRRAGEVAILLASGGSIVLASFISPYRGDRDRIRRSADGLFHEVWLSAGLGVCEGRDPKGLYRKARAGQISDFTGVSAPYEPPERPELVLDTGSCGPEQSVVELFAYIDQAFRV
jgi:bifunctional enzyme CysN/CysC